MKLLKNISIVMGLIVLTWAVVFVPQTISGQKENDIIGKVISRSYSEGNRQKLTSEQVARFFYDSVNSYTTLMPVYDTSEMDYSNMEELLELLFGDEETICANLKERLVKDETLNVFRNSALVKVDNQPIALNFVNYENKMSPYFSIFFEEKTKTILRMALAEFVQEFETMEDMQVYVEQITSTIHEYYKKQINLGEKEYFCYVEVPTVIEVSPNRYAASIVISCGVQQLDEMIHISEKEIEKDTD